MSTAPAFRWSLVGIWLAGVVVFVLRLLSGHLSVMRIARGAVERAEAEMDRAVHELVDRTQKIAEERLHAALATEETA